MIPATLISFAKPVLNLLRKLLTFGVTLPVWLFLIAGTWLWIDKSSSIRAAVDTAVMELVAGEELAAERARTNALLRIANEVQNRLRAEEAANRMFADRLAEAERNSQELSDEIQTMLARPVAGDCTVDGSVLDRLRNR